MASELIVQTLKGPTGGANANKVIIPSGQTLDMSAGTLTPSSGQIVQTVTTTVTTELSHGSGSYANFMTVDITTKTDNPKLICICEPARLVLGYGSSTAYTRFVCTGGEATGIRHQWVNRNTSAGEYLNPIHTSILETSSAPTGTTLTVALQISNVSGAQNDIVGDNGQTSRLTVMEIAG